MKKLSIFTQGLCGKDLDRYMVGFVSNFSTYPGKRCRKPATITLLKYYIWHLNAHCSKLARVAYLKPKWFRTYMVIAIQWGMSPAVRAPITFFLIYRHRVPPTTSVISHLSNIVLRPLWSSFSLSPVVAWLCVSLPFPARDPFLRALYRPWLRARFPVHAENWRPFFRCKLHGGKSEPRTVREEEREREKRKERGGGGGDSFFTRDAHSTRDITIKTTSELGEGFWKRTPVRRENPESWKALSDRVETIGFWEAYLPPLSLPLFFSDWDVILFLDRPYRIQKSSVRECGQECM